MSESREALEKLKVLEFVPQNVRKLIIDSFVEDAYTFGSPIISEGQEADAFYVLVSGRARVVKQGDNGAEISLNTLRPGESFGEMGILEDTASKATVRASTDVQVLKLDRAV